MAQPSDIQKMLLFITTTANSNFVFYKTKIFNELPKEYLTPFAKTYNNSLFNSFQFVSICAEQ